MTGSAAETDTLAQGAGRAARPVSPAREITPAWAGLVLLAGLAWLIVVRQSVEMDAGTGTMGISPALFLAMWLAMMVAMMFPSVAPVALMWTRSIRGRSHGARRAIRIIGFLSGYLVAWLAYGALAFAGLLGVDRLIGASPAAARWLGVGIVQGRAGYEYFEVFNSTFEEPTAVERAAIDVVVDGLNSRFAVAAAGEAVMQPLRSPVSGEENDVRIVKPGGFIWKEGRVAQGSTLRVDLPGISFDVPGRHAVFSTFDWSA